MCSFVGSPLSTPIHVELSTRTASMPSQACGRHFMTLSLKLQPQQTNMSGTPHHEFLMNVAFRVKALGP